MTQPGTVQTECCRSGRATTHDHNEDDQRLEAMAAKFIKAYGSQATHQHVLRM